MYSATYQFILTDEGTGTIASPTTEQVTNAAYVYVLCWSLHRLVVIEKITVKMAAFNNYI